MAKKWSKIELYATGCKKLSQVRDAIIKQQCKGNSFLYMGEPNAKELQAASRKRAEEFADQLIQSEHHLLPARIKRDIEVVQ